MNLISDILARIFIGESRFVVVTNRDGFLLRHREEISSEYGKPVKILSGSSLDLRIAIETDFIDDTESRFIFIPTEEFELMDDVANIVDAITFNIQRLFLRYHWATINSLSLAELDWLYSQKQRVNLSEVATRNLVCEYRNSPDYRKNALNDIHSKWDKITANINFRKPTEWMPKLARLMLSAIELKGWDEFGDKIQELNESFQDFLRQSYQSLVGSSLGSRPPRIVTQIAPYIYKQNDTRSALIVVDGMNFWQSTLLCNALENQVHGITFSQEAILAWLPSVTELSRQAIFSGTIPSWGYAQNPHTEKNLWESFWKAKRLPKINVFYQHSGELTPTSSAIRIGYVNTDLDEMMHSAQNFNYLYDDTRRWVEESTIVADIEKLIADNFTVYITSDHGNIETRPYRAFSQQDKAGATCDNRYIRLPEVANRSLFENAYQGHITQIDPDSRTYFAVDRELFSSRSGVVTHGGTHFLEVLVPFITIKPAK